MLLEPEPLRQTPRLAGSKRPVKRNQGEELTYRRKKISRHFFDARDSGLVTFSLSLFSLLLLLLLKSGYKFYFVFIVPSSSTYPSSETGFLSAARSRALLPKTPPASPAHGSGRIPSPRWPLRMSRQPLHSRCRATRPSFSMNGPPQSTFIRRRLESTTRNRRSSATERRYVKYSQTVPEIYRRKINRANPCYYCQI